MLAIEWIKRRAVVSVIHVDAVDVPDVGAVDVHLRSARDAVRAENVGERLTQLTLRMYHPHDALRLGESSVLQPRKAAYHPSAVPLAHQRLCVSRAIPSQVIHHVLVCSVGLFRLEQAAQDDKALLVELLPRGDCVGGGAAEEEEE